MTNSNQGRAWARIDLSALKSNMARVRQLSPDSKITAVIKANGYGHGVEAIARTLSSQSNSVDCFAVATMDEVVALNVLGTGKRILLLQGYSDASQLRYLTEAGVEFVLHADYQLALLKAELLKNNRCGNLTVWLKFDTGMNRLGFCEAEFKQAFSFLHSSDKIGKIILMSHLACADKPNSQKSVDNTNKQVSRFKQMISDLGVADDDRVEMSLAASAGILSWPKTHYDLVRPGIMLYGGSPFADTSGADLGLEPVMTLCARLIAIKDIPAGGSIGYSGTYTCDRDTRIGVVSIGYGDGYPRAAPNGTPVLVKGDDGYCRTPLLGRVSMDMITIDLSNFDNVSVGDEVVLWGDGLPADEVAKLAGTISYELFCQVTQRVHFIYS